MRKIILAICFFILFTPASLFIKVDSAKAAGPATTSWSTFGYNNQHVNRINAPMISSGASQKWRRAISTAGWAYHAIGPNGTIYVEDTTNDRLYALNPADGTVLWYKSVPNIYGQVTVRSDNTIVVTTLRYLYIFDSAGNILLQKRIFSDSEQSYTGMTIASDGSMYNASNFTNTDPGLFTKYDASGNVLWDESYFEGSLFPPALNIAGTQAFYSHSGIASVTPKQTISLNTSNGTKFWTNSPNRYARTAPLITRDGNVLVGYGSSDGYLDLYNGTTGATIWEKRLTGSIEPGAIAEGFDGTLYAANYSGGKLFAFDPNGTEKWQLALNSPAAIAVVNDIIYVKSINAPLYAVSKTGSILWQISTASMVRTSNMIVSNSGVIHFHGTDSNFYAISGITSPVVDTQDATNRTINSATLNGSIIEIGGSNATERGFYYGTDAANLGQVIKNTGSFGQGAFSIPLTGLSPNTAYFFKAFATNPAGTSYGSIKSFATLAPPPTVSLDSDRAEVEVGQSVNLTWVTTYTNACSASGEWTGAKSATGGTEMISSLTEVKTYNFNLSCIGIGGSTVSDSVSVVVKASPTAPSSRIIKVKVSWQDRVKVESIDTSTFLYQPGTGGSLPEEESVTLTVSYTPADGSLGSLDKTSGLYPKGQPLTIVATPLNSTIAWGDACSTATTNTCTLSATQMQTNQTVSAVFSPIASASFDTLSAYVQQICSFNSNLDSSSKNCRTMNLTTAPGVTTPAKRITSIAHDGNGNYFMAYTSGFTIIEPNNNQVKTGLAQFNPETGDIIREVFSAPSQPVDFFMLGYEHSVAAYNGIIYETTGLENSYDKLCKYNYNLQSLGCVTINPDVPGYRTLVSVKANANGVYVVYGSVETTNYTTNYGILKINPATGAVIKKVVSENHGEVCLLGTCTLVAYSYLPSKIDITDSAVYEINRYNKICAYDANLNVTAACKPYDLGKNAQDIAISKTSSNAYVSFSSGDINGETADPAYTSVGKFNTASGSITNDQVIKTYVDDDGTLSILSIFNRILAH